MYTRGVLKAIQFEIWDPQSVLNYSVLEVKKAVTYDQSLPTPGGLFDPKLGTIDRYIDCATCKCDMSVCPGHFGHINLARPIFHPGLLMDVKKILQCVCYNCSGLIIPKKNISVKKYAIISKMATDGGKLKYCNRCKVEGEEEEESEAEEEEKSKSKKKKAKTRRRTTSVKKNNKGVRQRKILKDGVRLLTESLVKNKDDKSKKLQKKRSIMTPLAAYNILEKISSEDCEWLGFKDYQRPEWLIITIIPVPPPAVRPSVQMDTHRRGEDDLTYKLTEIIRANNALQLQIDNEATADKKLDHWSLLQFHCATYWDNEIPKVARANHRSGRPIKGFKQRLKGKENRIRGNLMGKRVDFSARTVITPDPNLEIDEIGVPMEMALNLTYKEVVNRLNIDQCYQYLRNGNNKHVGANYVIKRKDGRKQTFDTSITKDPTALNLKYGDEVVRHIKNDDLSLFNRQPSLHRMSMMGHRIRVLPGRTFRLPVVDTTPYNADFDGDEMNLHIPQSETAKAELQELCMVRHNLIAPKNSNPIIGLVQGSMLAAYLISGMDEFITKSVAMNLLMVFKKRKMPELPPPAIMKPRELWTGKQILSLVLPDTLNIDKSRKRDQFEDLHEKLIVIEGEMISGVLTKKHLGTRTGSILHIIRNDLGDWMAGQFLNELKFLLKDWLFTRGFSVGIGDAYIQNIKTSNTMSTSKSINRSRKASTRAEDRKQRAESEKIEEEIRSNIANVETEVKKYMEDALTSDDDEKTIEDNVNRILNKAVGMVGKSIKLLIDSNNNLKIMVDGGSKGNDLNISQIIGCLGQQNVNGERVGFGFHRRTLPYYAYNDTLPVSRGFVKNSYKKGLSPAEYFFHAMAGREGLVDTAIKTGKVGYISRKLMKAEEGLAVQYDNTVRNSMGDIVQFLYAEDSIDPTRLEFQRIESATFPKKVFNAKYKYESDEFDSYSTAFNDANIVLNEEYEQLVKDRKTIRKLHARMEGIYRSGDVGMVYLCVNLDRVILNALVRTGRNAVSQMHPVVIVKRIEKLCCDLMKVRGTFVMSTQPYSLRMLFIAIRSKLSSKRVIKEYKFSSVVLDHVCNVVCKKLRQSLVNPGEMVGPISAESIAEPTQQMTLNTFHSAGLSSANVTLGVPRIEEIINAAQRPKKPNMTIYLDKNISSDAEKIIEMKNNMQATYMHDVLQTKGTAVFFDMGPLSHPHHVEQYREDKWWVKLFYSIHVSEDILPNFDLERLSYCVIRLCFNKQALFRRGLTVNSIAIHIKYLFDEEVIIAHSDINADCAVIRMRLIYDTKPTDKERSREEKFMKQFLQQHLKEMLLCGAQNISKVYISREDTDTFGDGDGEDKPSFYFETEGSDLKHILNWHGVDYKRTYCNNPTEIFNILGIEATRQSIILEIRKVMHYYGILVNYRHLSLLADTMTSRGKIMAISRHGLNRTNAPPLKKCTFEETVDMLLDAGKNAVRDELNSVSASIIVGKMGNFGTGMFDLKYDREQVTEGRENRNNRYKKPQRYYSESRRSQYKPRGKIRKTTPMMRKVQETASSVMGTSRTDTGYDLANPFGMEDEYDPTSSGYASYDPLAVTMSPLRDPNEYDPENPGTDYVAYDPANPGYSNHYDPASPAYDPASDPFSNYTEPKEEEKNEEPEEMADLFGWLQ